MNGVCRHIRTRSCNAIHEIVCAIVLRIIQVCGGVLSNQHAFLRCCSAYGDALFLVIQTVIMAALVLYYSGRAGAAATYCAV